MMVIATRAIATMINTHSSASPILPAWAAKKIAIAMVWVLPGILPASIKVAPNSPKALANARTVPAITPGQAKGSNTCQNTLHSEAPKVRAQLIKS